ncbi:MAG: hypothetical protein KTR32_33310 [Granulosicoccus sp.]|nr:hypothetical protein [Granulosicoccus sp.]
MKIVAKRLIENPIITPQLDSRIGENINGPSLLLAPEWLPNRLGKYYLYFAHHQGSFIRLAYSDSLIGPWKIYQPGVMDVKDSLFAKTDPTPAANSTRPDWAVKFQDDYLYAHVASPDVHIDCENHQILMYYHGLLEDGDQQTRLAISNDGIHFTAQKPLLGPPYFRVFQYQDYIYAFSWAGELHRSKHWQGPFENGPRVLPDPPDVDTFHGCRHCAVSLNDNTLTVFYSRIGDKPERIIYVTLALTEDWTNWRSSEPQTLLRPERKWEGADCAEAISRVGVAPGRLNELRDPCYFLDDDGSTYLLYSGAGESAIGLALLSEQFETDTLR